jgi:hypothetical protein
MKPDLEHEWYVKVDFIRGMVWFWKLLWLKRVQVFKWENNGGKATDSLTDVVWTIL